MPKFAKKHILLAVILFFLILLGIVDLPEIFQKSAKEKTAGPTAAEEKENPPASEKANLRVQAKSYDLYFDPGDSVYDAMLKLSQTNKLNFRAKSFAGIGYYVKEINGEKESGGEYWVFYINDCKPSVGVSEYKLKAGDNIFWAKETSDNQQTCLKK